ncbi:hypothetical protein OGAPHI_000248 [Ogataea philodendri]|uniref:Uncharacterized protein n=1 Tax=Ogataea philodendri TaxID=1378263 RepID=A0A9P8PHC2_9ASCO|nr:uncharacterized protein OGAPHI_000248 [Ogataea philodendri]KAH3671545.1 hypothetical protein OGAPHI_000248 [Ogataea philodendri]
MARWPQWHGCSVRQGHDVEQHPESGKEVDRPVKPGLLDDSPVVLSGSIDTGSDLAINSKLVIVLVHPPNWLGFLLRLGLQRTWEKCESEKGHRHSDNSVNDESPLPSTETSLTAQVVVGRGLQISRKHTTQTR